MFGAASICLDSFTTPLHSPNDRHMPAVSAVQRGCHWGQKKTWESPLVMWAHNTMIRHANQPISRPRNHKGVMPANPRPYILPHWRHIATRLGLCSNLQCSRLPPKIVSIFLSHVSNFRNCRIEATKSIRWHVILRFTVNMRWSLMSSPAPYLESLIFRLRSI